MFSCSFVTLLLRLPPEVSEVIPVSLSISAAGPVVSATLTSEQAPALAIHPNLIESFGGHFRGDFVICHFVGYVLDLLPYYFNRSINRAGVSDILGCR